MGIALSIGAIRQLEFIRDIRKRRRRQDTEPHVSGDWIERLMDEMKFHALNRGERLLGTHQVKGSKFRPNRRPRWSP